MHAGAIDRAGRPSAWNAVRPRAFKQMPAPTADKITAPNREQSNTTAIVDAASW